MMAGGSAFARPNGRVFLDKQNFDIHNITSQHWSET